MAVEYDNDLYGWAKEQASLTRAGDGDLTVSAAFLLRTDDDAGLLAGLTHLFSELVDLNKSARRDRSII